MTNKEAFKAMIKLNTQLPKFITSAIVLDCIISLAKKIDINNYREIMEQWIAEYVVQESVKSRQGIKEK